MILVDKISHVANLSHPVNLSLSTRSIDVTADNLVLDRDIILDIDLSQNRPTALMATEKYSDAQKYAVLLAFTPSLSDFMKLSERQEENNNEFIFIGNHHDRVLLYVLTGPCSC